MSEAPSRGLWWAEQAARPLDWARRGLLLRVGQWPALARWIGRRDTRIPTVVGVQVLLLALLTVLSPLLLFVVGPLVLGVPHLASDLRYLLSRSHTARAMLVLCASVGAAIVAVRALAPHLAGHAARAEVILGCAWIACALWLGTKEQGPRPRRLLLTASLLSVLGLVALAPPSNTLLWLAHAHNLIGVGLWALWFRRSRHALVPLLLLGLVVLALGSGALLPVTFRLGGDAGFGMRIEALGRLLAPSLPLERSVALATTFVFLQAAHYAAWLVWIPQEQLPHQGTFTFRMSLRALLHDLGAPLLLGLCTLWIALGLWALLDVGAALRSYLSLVVFHGWLELAVLAYWFAGGRAAPGASS